MEKYDKYMYDNTVIQVKFSRQKDRNDDNNINIIDPSTIKKEGDNAMSQFRNRQKYFNKDDKKQMKENAKKRKGRLVIRNLSFKVRFIYFIDFKKIFQRDLI